MERRKESVSVIVPSTGRDTLQQCLDALERQSRRPDEIIVVYDKDNLGVGLTRNKGILMAKGELIAFTDDDCVPPDNWIESLVSIMKAYDADVVGGTLGETDHLLHAKRARYPYPSKIQVDDMGVVGNGANIIFKHILFDECLQNDGYLYQKESAEDFELIWRLRKRKAKIIFTPNSVLHLKKITHGAYLTRQFGRGVDIANLHVIYRKEKGAFTAQPSLLWGHGKTGHGINWWKTLWVKVIGPFDVKSLPSLKDYFVFWFGEKMQGLGFLWGLILGVRK